MKRIKSYLNVLFGALIIALALNVFFVNREILPAGMLGFATFYSENFGMNLHLSLMLMSLFIITLGYITVSKQKIINSIVPIILVPIFTFLTKDITKLIDISDADFILITVFGAALIAIGSRYIYKENYMASASDIISEISSAIMGSKGIIVNYIIDTLLVFGIYSMSGFEQALYTVISIIIIEMMSYRTSIGVSTSKVFYIITKEEHAVKKFIMEDLKYDLTIFDVKGGFSKNKNRVLMSAIPTKDYYKLREGIREIDPHAFISITDSYELINENLEIQTK